MIPKEHCDCETLLSISQAIFSLNEENCSISLGLIISKFDKIHPLSSDLIIIHMIYYSFVIKNNNVDLFLNIIKEIRKFEEINKIKSDIFDIFGRFLNNKNSNESSYLLEAMIEHNFLEPNIVKNNQSAYFAHYMSKEELAIYLREHDFVNYEELSKNDWKLHKKYVKEGHNPNEIAKIIRKDEMEKLQEISSQTNFDYNQTIKPSLYERCSFINQKNVSLIDYAAFFGSIKCFKYLLMNNANVNNTGKYAIVGGNEEIIHLCEQNHSSFVGAYETAIEFHQNDIFKYFYENKLKEIKNLEELGKKCIVYHNYELLSYLQENDMKINDNIINEAVLTGNLFLTEYFLKFNQIPKNILVFSMESENVELIKTIIEKEGINININAKDKYGNTALIWASGKGHTEILKLLLEQKGIDINVIAKDGETALTWASQKGYTEIVKILLEQEGIDINAKDKNGYTALTWASKNGYTEIVKILLEQEGIDINAKNWIGETALMIASKRGYTEIVKLLLEQEGIDINAKNWYGYTALIRASWNGHTEIVKILLEQEGIDINAKDNGGRTALIDASSYGHSEIVKLLLEQKGIDINVIAKYGETALILASENGHTEIVKLLLEQEGIDINAKDKDRQTALIVASLKGHTDIVKLLLEQEGIDINVIDDIYFNNLLYQNNIWKLLKLFRTALMRASQKGHTDIVKLLLEQEGIDINAKDKYKQTALIVASWNGHTEIVKILLEQEGIDINAKDKYGWTALTWASQKGYTEIVKILLKQEGIDINAKDKDGETALTWASQKGYTEIVKILLAQENIDSDTGNSYK